MTLVTENIIPGNYGKVFETNATDHADLQKIKNAILKISGIKDVIIDETTFPKQITIHTTTIVKVKDVENAVKTTGFHALLKTFLDL